MRMTGLLLMIAIATPAAAFANSSPKAEIKCQTKDAFFYFGDTQGPEAIRILVDLSTDTANVSSQHPSRDELQYKFKVLKNDVASATVPESRNPKVFNTSADGNAYNPPRYLLLTGNNGDDTEFSVLVAYIPYGSDGSEELPAGSTDFSSAVTMTWMSDGHADSKTLTDCTMKLVR